MSIHEATQRVADCMDKILTNFKSGSKITVLVRAPGKPNADFCLTDDDLDEVIAMVRRRKGEAPPQTNLVGDIDCPCTTFEQDEDCPVGYPSLLCHACGGKGIAPIDKVVAFAAEMMKVAEQVDELEDPFAAWETIDLIKSQHRQLRSVVEELKFALSSSDMTIKDRADQSARLILAATEGQP